MKGSKVSESRSKSECDGGSLGSTLPETYVGGASTAGTDNNADPTPAQASRNPSRNASRRNKKVYKYVDLALYHTVPAPGDLNTTVTPAEFRNPTNGMPPMAIRNSEYAPVTGQGLDMHKTFGNMFQTMAARTLPKDFRKNEFSMKDDEFPSLK